MAANTLQDALRRLRTTLEEESPVECGNGTHARCSGKVLVRTGGSYLSKNADYSQENYHRRCRQRTRGFQAVDYLPYKSLGAVRLDPLDLVEDVFVCDLKPQLITVKEQKPHIALPASNGDDTPQLLATHCPETQSRDEEDVSELCDGCDQEDDGPGVSLHSGLSTMRLILGANDRRIYAQRFGLAHYDMALQREQKRMAYLKEMWAHSPQEAGHHPSKYLSPMVHTSSSKGCLVSMSRPNTRGQSDNLHDSERENNGDSPEMGSLDVPHDAMAHFKLFQQTTGRGSIKGEPNKQRGKRTRFNSFYVAMAATSFKTRPDKHRAKIKAMVEEQLKLDMLIAKLSSISRIFCALTNIRNRDLRSNQPIPPEALKQMMSKPNESFLRGDYDRHQQQHTPHIQLPPHLQHTNSHLSKVASRDHTIRSSYSPFPQQPLSRNASAGGGKVGQSTKNTLTLPPIGVSPSPLNPRAVNFDACPTWEDLQHSEVVITAAPAEGKVSSWRSHSNMMHGKPNPAPPHNTEATATGNRSTKEIPIWQKPMVCPDGEIALAKRAPKPDERVARAKQAFQDAKNRQSQKLQERMKEMAEDGQEYFVQILKELHLGPLVEVNLEQMRARAHDNIHKMKVKEDDKPLWYLKLEKETNSLTALHNNERLLHLMKKLHRFLGLNEITVSHLQEKLCLFVMSLPVYLLAQEHMIAAILFVLKDVLATSPDLLQLWADVRQLPLLSRHRQDNNS